MMMVLLLNDKCRQIKYLLLIYRTALGLPQNKYIPYQYQVFAVFQMMKKLQKPHSLVLWFLL